MKILVFDIGGTFIKYGIYTEEGLGQTGEVPTEAHKGGAHVIELVSSLIRKENGYDAIGISTTGQVDSDNGQICYANQNVPGYTGMKIREILEKRFQVPVMVENDVNAAAIGEAFYGAGKDKPSFICITYGTGIGGAIVEDRKIYHGGGFSAGEFGAIVTHGREKIEGTEFIDGCYERYASTTALVRKMQKYDARLTDGKSIFAARSDENVQRMIDEWIDEILVGLSTIIHIFNPKCIILGGGIMKQSYITDQIRNKLGRYIMSSFAEVEIVAASLGNNAGLYGINYLTRKYIQEL